MTAPDPMLVFDRPLVRRRRERAIRRGDTGDFLFAEVGARLADRLVDVRRGFGTGVDLERQARPRKRFDFKITGEQLARRR